MKPELKLALYSVFLFSVFLSAYLGFIPTELAFIPFFDSMGHFILYGIWGYLFAKVFDNAILSVGKFIVPAGVFIAIIIAVAEESFQAFFPTRSFSFFDMAWGILGISLACIIFNRRKIKEK